MSDEKNDPLASYSETDLYAELNRRAEERKAKAKLEREEHNAKVLKFLREHPEIMDLIEHDRTSCEDSPPEWGLNNGWSSREGSPRCNKCAVLESMAGNDDHPFKISFSIDLEQTLE